ncbi:MAG TPA: glutamate--cysteine ligase [Actinoplanes sp.]|jgi:carboxylate-amine ligase
MSAPTTDSAPPIDAARSAVAVPTVGVEEEFLLLDPTTGENAQAAIAVLADLPAEVRQRSRLEFRHSMVEMVTGVCTDLAEAGRQLRQLRGAAAAAAARAGTRLVAIGATPMAERRPTVTDNPRYQAIARHYGPIVADPAVCGCHVHVGVADRELAVQVSNHLRPWLPVVQALATNSPFFAGADTGTASWRAMQLDRWPSLGPAPFFTSGEDYDDTVRIMVDSGTMIDATMVLWHARPSTTYPTIEVRMADVCPTVADTLLVAGLVRALVATAIDDIAAGLTAPAVTDGVLRAAHWNAAHRGLGATLLDLRAGRARPAWDVVGDLVTKLRPALLRHGDLSLVDGELARVREEGTGADRQRRVHERTGDLRAVLAELAAWTVRG